MPGGAFLNAYGQTAEWSIEEDTLFLKWPLVRQAFKFRFEGDELHVQELGNGGSRVYARTNTPASPRADTVIPGGASDDTIVGTWESNDQSVRLEFDEPIGKEPGGYKAWKGDSLDPDAIGSYRIDGDELIIEPMGGDATRASISISEDGFLLLNGEAFGRR
jgi:hypothetical protein